MKNQINNLGITIFNKSKLLTNVKLPFKND
jgi:hypothetical protein